MPDQQADQTQIQGLPPGATLKPIETTPTDPSQIQGLPAGATLKPIDSTISNLPTGATLNPVNPSGLSDAQQAQEAAKLTVQPTSTLAAQTARVGQPMIQLTPTGRPSAPYVPSPNPVAVPGLFGQPELPEIEKQAQRQHQIALRMQGTLAAQHKTPVEKADALISHLEDFGIPEIGLQPLGHGKFAQFEAGPILGPINIGAGLLQAFSGPKPGETANSMDLVRGANRVIGGAFQTPGPFLASLAGLNAEGEGAKALIKAGLPKELVADLAGEGGAAFRSGLGVTGGNAGIQTIGELSKIPIYGAGAATLHGSLLKAGVNPDAADLITNAALFAVGYAPRIREGIRSAADVFKAKGIREEAQEQYEAAGMRPTLGAKDSSGLSRRERIEDAVGNLGDIAEEKLRKIPGAISNALGPALDEITNSVQKAAQPPAGLSTDTAEGANEAGKTEAIQKKGSTAAAKTNQKENAAKTDFKLAIPSGSGRTNYTDQDLETALPYLVRNHVNVEKVQGVEHVYDALENERQQIENNVKPWIEKYANEPLKLTGADGQPATIKQKLIEALAPDEARTPGFTAKAFKAISAFNTTNPSLGETDDMRAKLNSDNRAQLQKNMWDVSTARDTSPAFAARYELAQIFRDGQYDQLEAKGVQGVREKRQAEASIIRVRDAADRQIKNADKEKRGTGENTGLRGLAAKGAATAGAMTGAGVGAATGIPGAPEVGAMIGGYAGKKVGEAIAPGDLTRDELVQRAMKGLVTVPDTTTKITANKPEPPAPAPPQHPRENTDLHVNLASHYGEIVGETPYKDLENRFLSDVSLKRQHKVPLEPAEKKLVTEINQAKVAEIQQAQKDAEKALKEAEKKAKEAPKPAETEQDLDKPLLEQKYAVPRDYEIKVTGPDGEDRIEIVSGKSNLEALDKASKTFHGRSQLAIKSELPSTEEYIVPKTKIAAKIPARLWMESKPNLDTIHHELGHVFEAHSNKFPVAGIFSDLDPATSRAGGKASAGVDFSRLRDSSGKYTPESIGTDGLKSLLSTFVAGRAADEVFNHINREDNEGATGDMRRAKQVLTDIFHLDDNSAEEMLDRLTDTVAARLNHPVTRQMIEENAPFRETNLDRKYHYSPERISRMMKEHDRRMAEHERTNTTGSTESTSGRREDLAGRNPEANGREAQTEFVDGVFPQSKPRVREELKTKNDIASAANEFNRENGRAAVNPEQHQISQLTQDKELSPEKFSDGLVNDLSDSDNFKVQKKGKTDPASLEQDKSFILGNGDTLSTKGAGLNNSNWSEDEHSEMVQKIGEDRLQKTNPIRVVNSNVYELFGKPTEAQREEIARLAREGHVGSGPQIYWDFTQPSKEIVPPGNIISSGEGSVSDFLRAVDKQYPEQHQISLIKEDTSNQPGLIARVAEKLGLSHDIEDKKFSDLIKQHGDEVQKWLNENQALPETEQQKIIREANEKKAKEESGRTKLEGDEFSGDAKDFVNPEFLPPSDNEESKLYHVTTAKDKVLTEGLKSRKETRNEGLGGGFNNQAPDKISTTFDEGHANQIANRMKLAVQAARDEVTPREALDRMISDSGIPDDIPEDIAKALDAPENTHEDWEEFDKWFDGHFKKGDAYKVVQDLDDALSDIYTDAEYPVRVGFTASKDKMAKIDPEQIKILNIEARKGAKADHIPEEAELRFSPKDIRIKK